MHCVCGLLVGGASPKEGYVRPAGVVVTHAAPKARPFCTSLYLATAHVLLLLDCRAISAHHRRMTHTKPCMVLNPQKLPTPDAPQCRVSCSTVLGTAACRFTKVGCYVMSRLYRVCGG